MLNRKFIALVCIALVAGLLVGLASFYKEFETQQVVPFGFDVVHIYFQVLNVSDGAGIASERLISYVIVLNITNPTSNTFRITSLDMAFARFASGGDGEMVSIPNAVVNYRRVFPLSSMDYFWSPNTSRLVAFSSTRQFVDLMMEPFTQQKGYFYASLSCLGTDVNAYGTGFILKELPIERLGENEFVYNPMFKSSYFLFEDYKLDIGYVTGRIR